VLVFPYVISYVFWNEHEPYAGVYDFEGQNNIFEFIRQAESVGLLVILRPGPYACAERDLGGLPWWLLSNGTETIMPRTSDENFMRPVRRWLGDN
jgi:beta-galactosidase GanA